MELSKKIDAFYLKREERRSLGKEVDKLKAEENSLQAEIVAYLEEQELTSAGGTYVNIALKTQNEPTAKDWDQVWQYIQDTGEFDLLHKRLNNAAVKERWDDDKTIPGVGVYPVTKISITKVK